MNIRVFIKNGKIQTDKQRWQDLLNTFDGDCVVSIKPYKKDRTLDQNALYWKYLEIISDETGQGSPEELHEYFKRFILPPRFIKVMGKNLKIPESTTRLNTKQFTEYIDKISALTNIPIPYE